MGTRWAVGMLIGCESLVLVYLMIPVRASGLPFPSKILSSENFEGLNFRPLEWIKLVKLSELKLKQVSDLVSCQMLLEF